MQPASGKPGWAGLGILLGLFLLSIPACQLFNYPASIDETRVAIIVQQTRLVRTAQALTEIAEFLFTTPEPVMLNPSFTPSATLEPMLSIPTPEPAPPDLERHIRAAKILVFENMSASGYVRYVLSALDQANYFYLDVGSATGWFKTQLLANQEWDLIIAAVEAQRPFGGEYFTYLDQHAERGAALVVEYGNYDTSPRGIPDQLLSRCGVAFENNWINPDLRVFYWVQSDHPVFNYPNKVPSLRNAAPLWQGDLGDLLRIRMQDGQPTGDAVVLASTNPRWMSNNATLVTCLEGRVILQTFRSHEYQATEMIQLWQNYIYQALRARFESLPEILAEHAPTPAAYFSTATGTQPPAMPVEPAEPGESFFCGDALNASLVTAPRFQKSLFEHHASGTFMVLEIELKNLVDFPIQIWDGDYFLQGRQRGQIITLRPHKAATGYLYINKPTNLIQDVIAPGEAWRTSLAFDIDPNASALILIVRPGFEMSQQVCEVRIPLTQWE